MENDEIMREVWQGVLPGSAGGRVGVALMNAINLARKDQDTKTRERIIDVVQQYYGGDEIIDVIASLPPIE